MAAAKRMTKAQIIGELSEKTGLTKREVGAVFEGEWAGEVDEVRAGAHVPGAGVEGPDLALDGEVRAGGGRASDEHGDD